MINFTIRPEVNIPPPVEVEAELRADNYGRPALFLNGVKVLTINPQGAISRYGLRGTSLPIPRNECGYLATVTERGDMRRQGR